MRTGTRRSAPAEAQRWWLSAGTWCYLGEICEEGRVQPEYRTGWLCLWLPHPQGRTALWRGSRAPILPYRHCIPRRTGRLSVAQQALVAAEEAITTERELRREAESGRARALAELEAAVAELNGLRLKLDEARQDKVRGGGGGG